MRRATGAGAIAGPLAALFLAPPPVLAQEPVQAAARFSIDSTISVDLFRGQGTVDRPNIIVDVTAAARLGGGWLAYIRPWLRQPRDPEWDKEIYQAALQYSRPGRVATRLDLGYIAAPIGLGMLDMTPSVNPTIGPHFSYFTPMPAFDPGGPRVPAIASTYPLGGTLTASTDRWDTRVAVVASAPVRSFEINSEANPPGAPALVVGGGVTPKVGLRVGVSFAHGDYATSDELTVPDTRGRAVTMAGVETEYAFAHTKLSGELMRDRFEKAVGSDTAYSWFVQGAQTLSPRWFVAGRHEGVRAPIASSGALAGTRPLFRSTEATVGYRLSTDVTLRGSFLGKKAFARSDWDQQAGVSVVWTRRWW